MILFLVVFFFLVFLFFCYWCYYPHMWRDLKSPVCGIFSGKLWIVLKTIIMLLCVKLYIKNPAYRSHWILWLVRLISAIPYKICYKKISNVTCHLSLTPTTTATDPLEIKYVRHVNRSYSFRKFGVFITDMTMPGYYYYPHKWIITHITCNV